MLYLGPELVIISGGLGPTEDDLTRAAVAAVTNRTLELDVEAWIPSRLTSERGMAIVVCLPTTASRPISRQVLW